MEFREYMVMLAGRIDQCVNTKDYHEAIRLLRLMADVANEKANVLEQMQQPAKES